MLIVLAIAITGIAVLRLGWRPRRRSLRLFCCSLGLVISLVAVAPAQAAQEIGWKDLQPGQMTIADPLASLSPQQYADMSSLARIRWWLESGEVSATGPDAQRAKELTEKLSQQGIDVEQYLASLNQARQQWRQQSAAINPALEGQSIKLAGFVLPLDVSAADVSAAGDSAAGDSAKDSRSGHNEAKVQAAQAERQRGQSRDQSRGQSRSNNPSNRFLLVPYVGACIHVPPPAPNQMIYVEPQASLDALETSGLFDRVWVEGVLRQQPGTYDLFLVDGVRQVEASYGLELTAISPYVPEGTGLFDWGWSGAGGETVQGPWWQSLQARSSALVTGALVGVGDRRSPAALAFGLLIAFAYGVIHTLGPGHGKAVIVSYFVGQGGSFRKGASMGIRVAVFHVFSAILVAVLTDLLVRQTVGSAPGSYRIVRLVSYGAIATIGAWMLWKATQPQPLAPAAAGPGPSPNLPPAGPSRSDPLSPNLMGAVIEGNDQLNLQTQLEHQLQGDCGCYRCLEPKQWGDWISLAIGAVPCSGALLVLIYGLANNLLGPAILMVIAISVGMAIALTGVGVLALWGRRVADRRIALGKPQRQQKLLQGLRIGGAVCVLLLGTFLFGLTLASPVP